MQAATVESPSIHHRLNGYLNGAAKSQNPKRRKRRSRTRGPVILRVGQIAQAFGVSAQTVTGWIDRKLMRSHRIPTAAATKREGREITGERRVRLEDAITFGRQEGLPVEWLEGLVNK